MECYLPMVELCERAKSGLAKGNPERPAHDEDAHRRGDLFAAEPVGHHLGEEDGAENKSSTTDQTPGNREREAVANCKQHSACRQAGQANANQRTVACVAPDVPS